MGTTEFEKYLRDMKKKERRFRKTISSLSELFTIENPKIGDYVVYWDNLSHKGYEYVYIEGESWMQGHH